MNNGVLNYLALDSILNALRLLPLPSFDIDSSLTRRGLLGTRKFQNVWDTWEARTYDCQRHAPSSSHRLCMRTGALRPRFFGPRYLVVYSFCYTFLSQDRGLIEAWRWYRERKSKARRYLVCALRHSGLCKI